MASHDHSHHPDDIARRFDSPPQVSYLRDWIYGGIDGAITNFAIVAGVSGAALGPGVALVLGLANLLADGFSMAASSYSGAKTERDEYERLRRIELRHIRQHPEGERQELRQIYINKGLKGADLERVVEAIAAHEDALLETMLTEEYGLAPVQRSPILSALATFAAFMICGAVPLIPFVFGLEAGALVAAGVTGFVFLAIGAAKSRWSSQSWYASALETFAIGMSAAGLAWFVGAALRGLTGLAGV